MGILEFLTLIFVILKCTGTIAWSWWLVLLPEIIALSGYAILYFTVGATIIASLKNIWK